MSEGDTERVTVRTYVPKYQRDEWDDHAEDLDMSRSEFIRTMVQAGRRTFGNDDGPFDAVLDTSGSSADSVAGADGAETSATDRQLPGTEGTGATVDDDDSTGTGDAPISGAAAGRDTTNDLETQVVETLSGERYLSWDELLAAVTDDIEDRLEVTLQELQAGNRVRYSGRNGGYTLDEQ